MDDEPKQQLARQFLSVLAHPDAEVIRRVAIESVIWTFPGKSIISGEAHGVDGVIRRAQVIARHRVNVEVIWTVYGLNGVTMILHNTASRVGGQLDEHVAGVFTFSGDKISRLDTFLSNVPMAEAFFV